LFTTPANRRKQGKMRAFAGEKKNERSKGFASHGGVRNANATLLLTTVRRSKKRRSNVGKRARKEGNMGGEKFKKLGTVSR